MLARRLALLPARVRLSALYSTQAALPQSRDTRFKVFLDRELAAALQARKHKSPTRRARIIVPGTFPAEAAPATVLSRAQSFFRLDHAVTVATRLVDAATGQPLAADGPGFPVPAADGHVHLRLEAVESLESGAPTMQPVPEWLRDLPPLHAAPMQMVSFYAFFDQALPAKTTRDLDALAARLRSSWEALGALGRVYIAREGLNAQMAVPVPAVARLQAQVKADTGLDVDINGGEVLPRARFPLASKDSEAEVVGAEEGGEAVSTHASAQQQPLPPFQRLAVIVRPQVLADGLPRPLDLSRVPAPLSPQDWHAQLPNAAIVLDVRNDYEFEVGRFANATPLETRTFRETWPALDRLLAPITDKTAPVFMYCTGGIRCVKAGAYVQDHLGYTNVQRLDGGIIAYARYAQAAGLPSRFLGQNYVFDNRMTAAITDDVLAACKHCGSPSTRVVHCANLACDIRLDLCAACAAGSHGGCSPACAAIIVAEAAGPKDTDQPTSPCKETGPTTKASTGLRRVLPPADLAGTVSSASFASPAADPDADTRVAVGTRHRAYADTLASFGPHSTVLHALYPVLRDATAASFPAGAHMLATPGQAALLSLLVRITKARRVLELGSFTGMTAAALAAGLRESDAGACVLSVDHDARVLDVARAHCPPELRERVSFVHGDALRVLDNLRSEGAEPFDLVFLDADKRRYPLYLDALLDGGVLRRGGLLVVDNALFRGHVAGGVPAPGQRQRAVAAALHAFNSDVRLRQGFTALLPAWDGLVLWERAE